MIIDPRTNTSMPRDARYPLLMLVPGGIVVAGYQRIERQKGYDPRSVSQSTQHRGIAYCHSEVAGHIARFAPPAPLMDLSRIRIANLNKVPA